MFDGIEIGKRFAVRNGGKLLSHIYRSLREPLRWQCAQGHVWFTPLAKIKIGRWCPTCRKREAAKSRRLDGLNIAKHIAGKRGGDCLSTEYHASNVKLLWKCSRNHTWRATLSKVKDAHTWCPKCAKPAAITKLRSKRLVFAKTYAKSRGGECLSEKYFNTHTALKWRCSVGHVWRRPLGETLSEKLEWCKECSKLERDQTRKNNFLRQATDLALVRGGSCLSKTYQRAVADLIWKCERRHIFRLPLAIVKNGQWCSRCSQGIGEKICRTFFEQIFRKPFKSVFPDWLKKENGYRMQLDGYCEELNVAFEHQGEQHYRSRSFFGGGLAFRRRLDDDALKAKLCRERGIKLLRVPAIPSILPLHQVKSWVKRACEKARIVLPENFDSISVKLSEAYNQRADDVIGQLRRIARERGGKCLSKVYLGSWTKLLFQCANDHRWETRPGRIIRGHWCKKCARKALSGSKHPMAKLNEEAVRTIIRLRHSGFSYAEIAQKLGCAISSVRSVCGGITWSDITGIHYRADKHLRRLNVENVQEIIHLASSGVQPMEIAEKLKFSDTTIYNVLLGKTWSSLTGIKKAAI